MIDRLDKVKEDASAELGATITRATVARAAFDVALGRLEGSGTPLFFEAVRAAVVKRGRKPSSHLTQISTPPELEAIAATYDQVRETPVLCDLPQARDLPDSARRIEPDRPTCGTSVQAAPEEP